MGVQTGDGTNAAPNPGVLASPGIGTNPATVPFTGLILCSANLPDKIAISVDAQSDDGIGTSGTVRGQDQAGSPNPLIAATASTFVETGTNNYVVCRTLL